MGMDETTDEMRGEANSPADAQPWRIGTRELLARVQARIAHSRGYHAVTLGLIAELNNRGVAGEFGYRDTVSLLGDALVLTRREASRLTGHAQALTALPLVAAAAAEGRVSAGQVTAIAETVAAMPAWATPADREVVEKTLTDAAGTVHANGLRKWGRELLYRLDQDGPEPREPEPLVAPHNELDVTVTPSGRVRLAGELDPEPGALLTTLLSSLTTPKTLDGQPDPRTPAQRAGDGLADILYRAADTGTLPEDGGQKPHLTITVPLETLRTGIGKASLHTATTGGTIKLSAAAARRIACDCELVPMVLGARSEPLDVGRASRTVPTAMRKAVITRDHGHCAFPSCQRPAQWSDIHHARHWLDGGTTKLDNLAVICRQHHTLLHHSEWRMTINNGIPTFIPPTFIDPQQKPRTNRLPGPAPG